MGKKPKFCMIHSSKENHIYSIFPCPVLIRLIENSILFNWCLAGKKYKCNAQFYLKGITIEEILKPGNSAEPIKIGQRSFGKKYNISSLFTIFFNQFIVNIVHNIFIFSFFLRYIDNLIIFPFSWLKIPLFNKNSLNSSLLNSLPNII